MTCPLPNEPNSIVLLAHGGGGRLTEQLLNDIFFDAFSNPILNQRRDSAVFNIPPGRIAMTTDSFVVRPLFFPGGDIGSLAVYGAVNDLAMCGARPLYLTAGFIIEEGLPLETLRQIALSMGEAARRCGVQIIAGDTKVVDRGKGDGLFINTTGLGIIETPLNIGPSQIQAGDAVILSGDLARHGMSIMAVREGLQFESQIESDMAPLHEIVLSLLKAGLELHCARDLTRGGLAAALNEIAKTSGARIEIQQKAIPIREDVHAACEILGLDPLLVANEGRFAAFLPAAQAAQAVALLRGHSASKDAAEIGVVANAPGPLVVIKNEIGLDRVLDMPSGGQLPRIC